MPQIDFKKNTDSPRWQQIWRENHGNWLLSIGILVSLVAWSVGYFELIPEVTANRRAGVSPILATGSTLLVRVSGCASEEGQVVAMLYHAERFNSESVPIRIESLEVSNREALWRIHNLQFGQYIIIAFHDIDANEQFERGVEKQGVSSWAIETDAETVERRRSLADGVFSFSRDKLVVEVAMTNS